MQRTPPRTIRKLRPREPVTPAAIAISQLNCAALLGIDARRFLELLGAHPDVPRAEVGKLRVVELAHVRELLRRLSTSNVGEIDLSADDLDDDTPSTADDVLAALGQRRAS